MWYNNCMNGITLITVWHTPGDDYATCYIDIDGENLRTFLQLNEENQFERGIVTYDPQRFCVKIQNKTFPLAYPNSIKRGCVGIWDKQDPVGNYKPYVGDSAGYYEGTYSQYDSELDPWYDE